MTTRDLTAKMLGELATLIALWWATRFYLDSASGAWMVTLFAAAIMPNSRIAFSLDPFFMKQMAAAMKVLIEDAEREEREGGTT